MENKTLNLTNSECNCLLGALKFSMDNMPNTAFIRWGICYDLKKKIQKQIKEQGKISDK